MGPGLASGEMTRKRAALTGVEGAAGTGVRSAGRVRPGTRREQETCVGLIYGCEQGRDRDVQLEETAPLGTL